MAWTLQPVRCTPPVTRSVRGLLWTEQFSAPEPALRTIAYARVSRHDRKDGLERQKQVLERDCARQDWRFEVIAGGMDLGAQALMTTSPGEPIPGPKAHQALLDRRLARAGSTPSRPRT